MNPHDLQIAKELKQKLAAIVPLVDMRVFGSCARGDADECSDLDVFIEVETLDKTTEEKIEDIVWEVGFNHSVFISQTIFTKDEIENSPMSESGIVKSIYREGIAI